MDIELAIDALEIAPFLDHLVLFSGDGDFTRLVEAVQRKGVRVTVVSTLRSQPPMVADELRRQADTFVELQELSASIARPAQWREQREPREPREVREGREVREVREIREPRVPREADYDDEEEAPDTLGSIVSEPNRRR
jgi:hypothetical protein